MIKIDDKYNNDCQIQADAIVCPESSSYIIENTVLFMSLCQKLDRLSDRPRHSFAVVKKESDRGTTNFYIRHTFHGVEALEKAFSAMKKGDSSTVKQCYDLLVRKDIQLTALERIFFLKDLSEFCDFLSVGMKNWNSISVEGSDITALQHVGSCNPRDVSKTHQALLLAIEKSSTMTETTHN